MAEIRVEPKKKATPVWIWIILGVVVLAAIIYFAMRNKRTDNGNAVNKPNQTSYIHFIDRAPLLA